MTDRTTVTDLRADLELLNDLTDKELELSSWSNGRRRVYSVVEILEKGGERKVSPNGYSSEIEYWINGYVKGLREARE